MLCFHLFRSLALPIIPIRVLSVSLRFPYRQTFRSMLVITPPSRWLWLPNTVPHYIMLDISILFCSVPLWFFQTWRSAASDRDILQCVDIEFALPQDCEEVTTDNCFNSSDITFAQVFTTGNLAPSLRSSMLTGFTFLPLIISGLLGFLV